MPVIVLRPPKECLLSESCEAGRGVQRDGSQEPMGKQVKQAPKDPGLWSERAASQLVRGFSILGRGKFGTQALRECV